MMVPDWRWSLDQSKQKPETAVVPKHDPQIAIGPGHSCQCPYPAL